MPDIPLYDPASLNDAIALAELALETAAEAGASDLHLEPQPQSMRIRMRVDGLMRPLHVPFDHLPSSAADALVVRFKLLSDMDIGERRRPQDGSFQWQLKSRRVDIRTSSLAGQWGEKLVLRLQWQQQNTQLDQQGLASKQLKLITQQLAKPQGLILVTGPTGSGKSMLLYSCLKQLQAPHLNLVSAEDPVEIVLPYVHQVAVNTEIGLSYNHILRALLRQDPDVIMLGELRDADSADVALKAAQTGHLLLTSMHTSSIGEAMHRCHGLGVDMLALSYCLSLIVNQRLVRRLCDKCKQPMSSAQLTQLSSDVWQSAIANYDDCYGEFKPCFAVGCAICNEGYRGRLGIFDVMPMDQPARDLVVKRQVEQLDSVAGVRQQGLWRVISGHTTIDEVNRVTW